MGRSNRSLLLRNSGNFDFVPDGYTAVGLNDGALTCKTPEGFSNTPIRSATLLTPAEINSLPNIYDFFNITSAAQAPAPGTLAKREIYTGGSIGIFSYSENPLVAGAIGFTVEGAVGATVNYTYLPTVIQRDQYGYSCISGQANINIENVEGAVQLSLYDFDNGELIPVAYSNDAVQYPTAPGSTGWIITDSAVTSLTQHYAPWANLSNWKLERVIIRSSVINNTTTDVSIIDSVSSTIAYIPALSTGLLTCDPTTLLSFYPTDPLSYPVTVVSVENIFGSEIQLVSGTNNGTAENVRIHEMASMIIIS